MNRRGSDISVNGSTSRRPPLPNIPIDLATAQAPVLMQQLQPHQFSQHEQNHQQQNQQQQQRHPRQRDHCNSRQRRWPLCEHVSDGTADCCDRGSYPESSQGSSIAAESRSTLGPVIVEQSVTNGFGDTAVPLTGTVTRTRLTHSSYQLDDVPEEIINTSLSTTKSVNYVGHDRLRRSR